MSRTRISSKPNTFVAQLKILDNLQKSAGTPPYAKKYQEWHWTNEESAEVSRVRQKVEEFYHIIQNKRNCPPEIKDEMKILIRSFLAYDHGKTEPHNLLNKIGLFGTITDWDSTNVKRGTPLAKTRLKGIAETPLTVPPPSLTLGRMGMSFHLIRVNNSAAPESRTTPHGYSSTLIFCYIGTESPVRLNQYEYVGKVNRGLFWKSFAELGYAQDVRIYAWYIARYETSRGKWSVASEPLKVEIILPTP
jgi:hypothetical protein